MTYLASSDMASSDMAARTQARRENPKTPPTYRRARGGAPVTQIRQPAKPASPAYDLAGLDRLRAQIDAINVKLVRLLNQRAKVAQAIGHLKQAGGAAIYQPARERAVLDRVAALNAGPLTGEHLRRIFVEIISACTALEHPLRVAYLGPEHTYSHEAARMRFGASAEFAAEPSIAAVFAALDTARADFGVVPVENSSEGSVTLTLDLLIDTPLVIIGEVLLPIRHALMSREGDAAAIAVIYSHQQSLGQCRNYLAANFPHCRLEAVASNTAAAARAAGEPDAAAIASEAAAAPYGLQRDRAQYPGLGAEHHALFGDRAQSGRPQRRRQDHRAVRGARRGRRAQPGAQHLRPQPDQHLENRIAPAALAPVGVPVFRRPARPSRGPGAQARARGARTQSPFFESAGIVS